MLLDFNHPSVRLTGRWHRCDECAATVCTGSYIEAAFKGDLALVLFDTSTNIQPFPHLWIELDGNGRIEVPLDRIIRIEANGDGPHHLRLIFKSAVETQNRWKHPLQAVLKFVGIDVKEPAALPLDEKPIIEFVGDSITEGILTYTDHCRFENFDERVHQDDACATYAWFTAEMLSMKPMLMGFGRIGVTIEGQGAVPPIQDAYPLFYEGAPFTGVKPKAVVINIGTNDMNASPDDFRNSYLGLLKVIRRQNPDAEIFALSPFVGFFEESLPDIVAQYNAGCNDKVKFISTAGWLPPEPVHPLRDGHKHAAILLTVQLRKYFG